MENKDYIKWIRGKVGHEKIIIVYAGGCIFNEKGEVLLQKRADCNKWGFPGGAVELGETPEMAAIREVKEETGLDVEVDKLIGIYTDSDVVCVNGDKVHSICIGYEMSIVGGELISDENETLELKFFSLNNMPELFCKQHEELLRDVKRVRN
ncbi:MAG: NUDIX hydrolase [Clostridia bacterium]|nr:NUDIX hydrolase [Clostridia bacterium]